MGATDITNSERLLKAVGEKDQAVAKVEELQAKVDYLQKMLKESEAEAAPPSDAVAAKEQVRVV